MNREKPLSDSSEILRLMAEGWELGYADGMRSRGRYWLQKDGLSRGGETKSVHASTARKMLKNDDIKIVRRKGDSFWLTRYVAQKKGTP